MAVQYPTAPFGADADLLLDNFSPLSQVNATDIGHKTCNSLYPLLLGEGADTGAAVTNHPGHSHQGGATGEVIPKNISCGFFGDTAVLSAAGGYTLSTITAGDTDWKDMQATFGTNPPMAFIAPKGADTVSISAMFLAGWTLADEEFRKTGIEVGVAAYSQPLPGQIKDWDVAPVGYKFYGSVLQQILDFPPITLQALSTHSQIIYARFFIRIFEGRESLPASTCYITHPQAHFSRRYR